MTHMFQCPQCGYRNYVTYEDLDRERAARRDKATDDLRRKIGAAGLGEPVRDFKSTFSAVGMVKRLLRLR